MSLLLQIQKCRIIKSCFLVLLLKFVQVHGNIFAKQTVVTGAQSKYLYQNQKFRCITLKKNTNFHVISAHNIQHPTLYGYKLTFKNYL